MVIIILVHDNTRLHIARMKLTDIYTRLYHIRHILLISHPSTGIFFKESGHFLRQKTLHSEEVETASKDFLIPKPLYFYCTGITLLIDARDAQMIRDHILTIFKDILASKPLEFLFKKWDLNRCYHSGSEWI